MQLVKVNLAILFFWGVIEILVEGISIRQPGNCNIARVHAQSLEENVQVELDLSTEGYHGPMMITSFDSNEVFQFDVPPTPTQVSKCYFVCPNLVTSLASCTNLRDSEDSDVRVNVTISKSVPFHRIVVHAIDDLGKIRLVPPPAEVLFSTHDHGFQLMDDIHRIRENVRNKVNLDREVQREKWDKRNENNASYLPKRRYPQIFHMDEKFLAPTFLQAARNGSREALLSVVHQETETGIYSLQLFNPSFLKQLMDEVKNIEKTQILSAPNTMNNYGVILDEFGFYPFLDKLMKEYIVKITSILYPEWGGDSLDDHHGFIVKYKLQEDTKLDYHLDSCEITLNVCLGDVFEGGSLFFQGIRNHPSERVENFQFSHVPGTALLHVGQHWHGANPIQSGERYNLILWMMSSSFRSSAAELFVKRCSFKDEL